MEPLYVGKIKDVFRMEEKDGIGHVGKFVMLFMDSATGYVIDEGEPTERVYLILVMIP